MNAPAGLPGARGGGAPGRQVIVVGGGLAGVLFAIEVMRQAADQAVTITVLEPRERLGAGVAYSTDAPDHVTNVPAVRMSAEPDDPASLTRWLERHGDAPRGDERDAYPRRGLYGQYLAALLARAWAAHPQVRLVHRRERAVRVGRDPGGGLWVATAAAVLPADIVALATGNPAPTLPGVLRPFDGAPGCIADPWARGALAGLDRDARVLIVGTGLTMGDTVASLRRADHRGPVVALSRRGQVPRRGLAVPAAPFGNFASPPATARGLLHLFRAEVRRAVAAGASWYGVLAAARAQAWTLWAALPPLEQRRAARHLRHVYELHRHVMPGPIHDLVAAERQCGALRIVAGRLVAAHRDGAALAVAWAPRDAPVVRERFDVVINCTGPSYATLTRTDPFWAALAREGLVRQDAAGIGPAADRRGRALDASGTAQPDVLLLGTLARSAFGELTGVREIALEARIAAAGALGALRPA